MKLKTKKLLSKRVKISGGRKKKVMIRTAGQDHFNSRESGNVGRNKKRDKQIARVNLPKIKKLLPYI